ncbi:hypothetical protein E4N71_04955 [Treponema vincentii]
MFHKNISLYNLSSILPPPPLKKSSGAGTWLSGKPAIFAVVGKNYSASGNLIFGMRYA